MQIQHTHRTSLVALGVLVAALLIGLHGGSALAAYPGENGKIAFQSSQAGGFDIWSMEPDGSGLTNLSNDPEHDDLDPIWKPGGGAKIAFVKEGNHNDIWVMNADGSGQTNLTPRAGGTRGGCPGGPYGDGGITPNWSPNGRKIAYSPPGQEIFVMKANGKGKTNITCTTEFGEFEPAYSPDGGTIAYRNHGSGVAHDIWAMASDGTNRRPLTSTPVRESFPDWSPDGTEIVYMRSHPAGSIWKMNADGSGQTLLFGPGSRDPAWSPDGTRIVFSYNESGDGGGYDLYVMNPDGSEVTKVPSTPAGDFFPSWQPL